jgi:hypothetical protein
MDVLYFLKIMGYAILPILIVAAGLAYLMHISFEKKFILGCLSGILVLPFLYGMVSYIIWVVQFID